MKLFWCIFVFSFHWSAAVPLKLQLEDASTIPQPDGLLHLYALPIGQGDTNIIQCPDGKLAIYDFGSSDKNRGSGFWDVPQIEQFLQGRFADIATVIISHNHFDHYSFLGEVLGSDKDTQGLENVYISCNPQQMRSDIADWLADIGKEDKVRTINNGRACGMNGVDCGVLDLCPGSQEVIAKVMSANYGEQCDSGNFNIDSIVIKLMYGEVSVLLNGDFEDFGSSWGENGPQKAMADYYGEEIQATVYQVSHHGASSKANKPVIRDAIHPKALLVSGNFWYGYGHPRCTVIDAFLQYVRTLCEPGAEPGSNTYCGPYTNDNIPMSQRVQSQYTCGESSTRSRLVSDNTYAIYSTTPSEDSINMVTFSTDGNRWGFITDIQPRLN